MQAYRLEPLIRKNYAEIKPVRIHRHDARLKLPYAEMPDVPVSGGTRDKVASTKNSAALPETAEDRNKTLIVPISSEKGNIGTQSTDSLNTLTEAQEKTEKEQKG